MKKMAYNDGHGMAAVLLQAQRPAATGVFRMTHKVVAAGLCACRRDHSRRHRVLRPPALLATLWFAVLVSLCFPGVVASSDEPGIDEKLGATIPADIQLRDEAGQPVNLKALIDKPTVLTLNYFRCAALCTPQLNNLVQTLNRIELDPGKDFQVLTVSFDPTDTPEIATGKRTNYLRLMQRPFPPLAWRFLTGDEAATKELANAVGFHFKQQGAMFDHAGALIILSPQGTVTRYLNGITYLAPDLQLALVEAHSGLVRPTILKALAFCYTYDPAGRKYVFNITRVAGAATLLFAAVFLSIVLLKGRRRTERLSA